MNSTSDNREWHNNSMGYAQTYSDLPAQNSAFVSNNKSPELPGMMALSQPGTPRPSFSAKKSSVDYTTNSFHATPYSTISRKRGRTDFVSSEAGPFFSSTKPADNLFALDRSTLLTARIQAKMDRGFFLAENDWTCYRRNYFQVSGAFSIHGLNHYYSDHEIHCLVQENGVFYPVHQFSLNISARVSNSDKKVELVQHTPKRDKGPQTTPSPKPIIPGGNLSMSAIGANQSIATFERIQFKTATANNGKRRAAQQYYVCLVDLYAEIEGNKRVKIASCQSAPLVVRGRSPGHYSDDPDRFNNRQQAQTDDNARYLAPFPRPPMTPPAVMGPDYNSPYSYTAPYSTNASYPHYPGMMPPTPTGNPPSNNNTGYSMVPGMTSDPSSSETSSPDLYNNEFHNGNGGPGPNNHHGLHGEVNKLPYHHYSEGWNRNNKSSTGYEQPHPYFSSQHTPSTYQNTSSPYGPPRKYSSAS